MKEVLSNIFWFKMDHSAAVSKGHEKVSTLEFLQSFVFLLLATALTFLFNIESDLNLPIIMVVATVGFVVSAISPVQFRLPIFLGMNWVAIFLLFGWLNGVVLISLGVLLVIISSLKINFRIRLALMFIATIFFGAIRTTYLSVPFLDPSIISVLGGLFMFRMMLYLYEIQNEKQPVSMLQRLSYFFLLPNLIFMIFPIVDYKTFLRNYFNKPAPQIYRKGLTWVLRGLWHLMLYRIIYYYIMPNPIGIEDIYSLMLYLASSYALIIRLSGIFHLSVGIICLFGFDLPETFNNYFLSSGFNDLWRRINIYWKDMVMKVFYFPIYFKFKNRNATAMFITVLIVFVFNWFLHAFQWFWIRGVFPIKTTDILFWAIFGVLVAINSLYQNNTKKKYSKSTSSFNLKSSAILMLQIIGMFCFMSLLWSFWNSNTIAEWWALMGSYGTMTFTDGTIILFSIVGIVSLGVLLTYLLNKKRTDRIANWYYDTAGINFQIGLMLIWLVPALPFVKSSIENNLTADLTPVFETQLNEFDEEQRFKGYYETLIVGNNLSSRIWELEKMEEEDAIFSRSLKNGDQTDSEKSPPTKERLAKSDLVVKSKDLMGIRIKPNMDTTFKNRTFISNSMGLRDKEYSLEKPEDVLRIALMGGSNEMGSGIANDQIFESMVERKLEQDFINNKIQRKVEIINFAVAGRHMTHQVPIFKEKVIPYSPDIVIYSWHKKEAYRNLKSFANQFNASILDNHPVLRNIARKAGLVKGESFRIAEKKLLPFQMEIVEWAINEISNKCKEKNIKPYWLYIDTLGEKRQVTDDTIEQERSILTKYGFTELNISEIFENETNKDLMVSKWDAHPNARAHEIIAKGFYRILIKEKVLK